MADPIPLPDACAEGIGALLGAAEIMKRLGHPKVGLALVGHAQVLADALLAHSMAAHVDDQAKAAAAAIEKARTA